MKIHFFKTCAIIGISVLFSANSYAQTKEETEKWINDKFKNWENTEYSTDISEDGIQKYYKNVFTDFLLKDGKLSVKSTYKYLFDGSIAQGIEYVVKEIPVNKISSVLFSTSYGNDKNLKILEFYMVDGSSYNIKKREFNDKSKWEVAKNETENDNYFVINITNSEENFKERFQKALDNYKSFYPIKKETF